MHFSFASRVEKPLDLQLPTPAYECDYTPVVTTTFEPPPRVFKEKTISKLDDDEDSQIPNTFKKRKIGSNKRNARRKIDDDD